jgi:hypothetical protein
MRRRLIIILLAEMISAPTGRGAGHRQPFLRAIRRPGKHYGGLAFSSVLFMDRIHPLPQRLLLRTVRSCAGHVGSEFCEFWYGTVIGGHYE